MLPVNYLAILLAGVVYYAIGALWYSPMLFGKLWSKLNGFDKRSKEEWEKMKKGMGKKYAMTFLGCLISACVLAIFIKMMAVQTFMGGFRTGFLAWVGFAATAQFANWVYSGKSKDLFIIDTTYPLVAYLLMGIILALWK